MFAQFSRIDALLLLMTLIWGTNFSIVKIAFRDIDPQAFNVLRMVFASAVFAVLMAGVRRRAAAPDPPHVDTSIASIFHTPAEITRRDWAVITGLGIVGHFVYQILFIGGLARTSVANSSLLLAATPVVIALLTAALGHERVSGLHWAGTVLSLAGIYLVIGGGVVLDSQGFTGDLMMLGAVLCWAIYTIGARELMERHSPVGITGASMIIGTLLYVPAMWPSLASVEWGRIRPGTWVAIVYSALFALCVAYTIWYAGVRQLGSARTSMYSNIVPLVAMATAVVFLGEPLGAAKIAGAALVLVGVALTRVGRRRVPIPPQE